jgi:hypothetical protein
VEPPAGVVREGACLNVDEDRLNVADVNDQSSAHRDNRGGVDVFMSYAREDRDRASHVAATLQDAGWSVWWDRDIDYGKPFHDSIADALARAQCVVVLWSQASIVSSWVREECHDALKRNLLLPVFLEPVEPPIGFRLLQGLELFGRSSDDASRELLAAVEKFVGHPAVEREAPPPVGSGSGVGPRPGPRPRSIALAVSAALLAATVAAVGGWYWNAYYRAITEHYRTVSWRWGNIAGVGQLSAAEVAHRTTSLAIIRRGRKGRPFEIRVVDSRGRTPPSVLGIFDVTTLLSLNVLPGQRQEAGIELPDSIATTRVTLEYDESGRLLNQVGYNRGGRPLYTLHFPTPTLAAYTAEGFGRAARESGITHLKLAAASGDGNGAFEDVMFLDNTGKPRPDHDGAFGVRTRFRPTGQASEFESLGEDGKPRSGSSGVAKNQFEYHASGELQKMFSLDANGQPTLGNSGTAGATFERDRYGNIHRITFIDKGNKPTVNSSVGCAGRVFKVDDRGRLVESQFFDADGNPARSSLGIAKQVVEWDGESRAIERYFGIDGRPALLQRFIAATTIAWESRGYPAEYLFAGVDGRPAPNEVGCYGLAMTYDRVGNLETFECRGATGTPIRSTQGYVRFKSEFDSAGHETVTRFFGPDGKPDLYEERFVARRTQYDAQDHLARQDFLDSDGKLVATRDGYASSVFEYNEQGNQKRIAFFDPNGKPISGADGYAEMTSTFDARGRETERTFRGADGRPIVTADGYARVVYKIDERGLMTATDYQDAAGRPVRIRYGYAGQRFKYDQLGRLTEAARVDETGAPKVLKPAGFAIEKRTYDRDRGLLAERAFFDETGRPMVSARGYARVSYVYDDSGREISRLFRNLTGGDVVVRPTVFRVVPDSNSARLGFREGDRIVAYDGESTSDEEDFRSRLELVKGERPREIRVARDGRVLSIDVPAGRLWGLELVDAALDQLTSR